MNYLSHARDHLDTPYGIAGTSLPDWLRVLGRDFRLDPNSFPGRGDDLPAAEQALIAGARQHFHDDHWFHGSPAFVHVTGLLTDRIRGVYPEPIPGPRPRHLRASFFGHVLMELLLDGWLIEQDPDMLERYYAALDAVDAERIRALAATLLGKDPARLPELIRKFQAYPFLRTYVDDREVAKRLDQVGGRVRLPALPPDFHRVVTWARDVVREHGAWLLTEPAVDSAGEPA